VPRIRLAQEVPQLGGLVVPLRAVAKLERHQRAQHQIDVDVVEVQRDQALVPRCSQGGSKDPADLGPAMAARCLGYDQDREPAAINGVRELIEDRAPQRELGWEYQSRIGLIDSYRA
jgi:hypothetical protein